MKRATLPEPGVTNPGLETAVISVAMPRTGIVLQARGTRRFRRAAVPAGPYWLPVAPGWLSWRAMERRNYA